MYFAGQSPSSVQNCNYRGGRSFLTNQKIAALMGISKTFVNSMLRTNRHMICMSFCCVIHHLTLEPLQNRVNTCNKWKRRYPADSSFLLYIITIEETWRVYYYDSLSQREATHYKSSDLSRQKKKIWRAKSIGKVLIIPFFDGKGMFTRVGCPQPNVTDPFFDGKGMFTRVGCLQPNVTDTA